MGRTLQLVQGVAEADLDRVHDPLMSPLVWDLGHIAAFEDLWVCREAGLDLLRPDLADVYDALTSKRVYKDAFAHDVAKGIIVKDSGTHFAPEVVEAFLASEQAFIAISDRYRQPRAAVAA